MNDLDFGATLKGFNPGQKIFQRYTLKKILGRGGMGVVWLAQDGELDREVALKFLPEIVALDPEALADLKRETRRNLDLTHPHIVRIYDFVADARTAAISMEYVNGAALSALKLDKPARIFTTGEIRGWVSQLVDALHYAHTKAKVVHRDLKPANLMVTKDGDMKITDFGIARGISDSVSRVSAQAGGSSGTPVYMSPQQMMGEKPAVTDDIYALGATLYELLTGKPPFHSGNIFMQVQSRVAPSIAERRRELEVTGEILPANWDEAIAACLAKEPARRPQSMIELGDLLGCGGGAVRATVLAPATYIPPVSVPVTPVPAAGVPSNSWFRQWILVPAAWGIFAAMVVAFAGFLIAESVGNADSAPGVAFVGFVVSWPFLSFVISVFSGMRRARREEIERLRVEPGLVLVPVARRWFWAPLVSALPVAMVIAGLVSAFEPAPAAAVTALLLSWLILSLFSALVLALRRPWTVRSARGITALGMILAAPLGAIVMAGDVGQGTVIMGVVAAGYLGAVGGWLLHWLAVQPRGALLPAGGSTEKGLHWLRALGTVVALAILFGLLPDAVAEIKNQRTAVAAERARVAAAAERVHLEQMRVERRTGAQDMINLAFQMVFDRRPTPAELADYTEQVVEHTTWDAAELRKQMRASPAGLKGGRLLVPVEFPTIAAAIQAALPGNAVYVAAGTYREHLILDKSVDLRGAGRDQVIIEGDRSASTLHVVGVNGATISGLTFRHTDTDEETRRYAAVAISKSRVEFVGNAITAANGHGLAISGTEQSPTVRDNLVRGVRWTGIYVYDKGSAEILDNEVRECGTSGISISEDPGSVTIKGNKLLRNASNGIWVEGGSTTLIDNVATGNSTSGGNYGGIGIGSGRPVLRGNIARDNQGGGIWWAKEAQPKIGEGNFSDGKELPVTP